MSTSANALALLTFAVRPRVAPVQALAGNMATTIGSSAPAALATLINTGQAAAIDGRLTDSTFAKGSAGVLTAAVAAAALPATMAGDASPGNLVRIGMLGRALAAVLPATSQARLEAPLLLSEMDVPALETARFALMLARAVTQSGISYEAHLLDWVEGRRSVDQVRAEPRAQITAPVVPHLSTVPTAAATFTPILTMAPNAAQAAAQAAAPAQATTGLPASADTGGAVESLPLAWTAAQQITAAQLRCIDSGDLRFALQAWPGQVCELHLRLDEYSTAPQYREAGTPQSDGTLVLTLPHLGKVEARLRTSGDNVQITLSTDSLAAADQFKHATAALSHGLGLAGLKLVSVGIHEPRA